MYDKVYVGKDVASFENAPAFTPYSKVILWYDDENAFTAGDDTGRTMEADCPWATQAMAERMLDKVKGFAYRPFSARDAQLDLAAELGDGVTVNGVYSVLASIDTTFDAMCAADIGAPGEEEIDHEYPYLSPVQREMARRVTLGTSYYGTRISRKNGLEITRGDGGTEKSRVILNSDLLAFYNDDGSEALYFDSGAGKFRFQGDVAITGGTMNINNNFIVDKRGNLTLNGNINMSGGTITWGGSSPVKYEFSVNGTSGWHSAMTENDKYRRDSLDGGITWGSAYQFRGTDGKDGVDGSNANVPDYIKRTYIDFQSVSSPTIRGGHICGAIFSDINQTAKLTMGSDGGASSRWANMTVTGIAGTLIKFEQYRNSTSGNGYTEISSSTTIKPVGDWDFSSANVAGLHLTFS